MRKSLMQIQPRDLGTPANSVIEALTNFVCCQKVYIHMSTWIAGKDSMKRHCQTRKKFTVI